MNRVNWDGMPLTSAPESVPDNLRETIFEYLPRQVPITPAVDELAEKYLKGKFTALDYGAMQAAAFVRPRSAENHRKRREVFSQRVAEAKAAGFTLPQIFHELVETDSYVDRLHHNTIWLSMPEELWRLPSNPSQLVFLAFTEGQGCCNWHLLLSPDGSHSMVCCDYPFGLRSIWPGSVPDYSQWVVSQCADSLEEWLYHYFHESAEHDRRYMETLRPYLSTEGS